MRFEIVFTRGMGYGDGAYTARTPFHEIIYKFKNQLNRAIYDEWLLQAALMIRDRLEARFKRKENPDGTPWLSDAEWRNKRRTGGILFRTGDMQSSIVLTKIQRMSISITNDARSVGGFNYPSHLMRTHPEWNWWQPSDGDIDEAAGLMREKIQNALRL